MPSEYSRADVASPSVWSAMRSTSWQTSGSGTYCVDTLPIVAARGWFYSPKQSMHIDEYDREKHETSFAVVGESVTIRLNQAAHLSEPVSRCFGYNTSSDQCQMLQGVISHTWNVRHTSRCIDEEFKEHYSYSVEQRDQEIAHLLRFSTYSSPNDLVTEEIPELPREETEESPSTLQDGSHSKKKKNWAMEFAEAVKARRAAVRRRNLQRDQAWATWEKPLVKPGDFVVLLRPSISEARYCANALLPKVDRDSRICIVHRFWV